MEFPTSSTTPRGAESPPPEDPGKDFLKHFAEPARAGVSIRFVRAVRAGGTTPAGVVARVQQTAERLVRDAAAWGNTHAREGHPPLQPLLDALATDPEGAAALAEWAIAWERLSPEEKARIQKEQGAYYRRQAMARQPATPRQIEFIRALGWRGPVESKAHAGDLIDRLHGGRRV
jgi:hypothetical protein